MKKRFIGKKLFEVMMLIVMVMVSFSFAASAESGNDRNTMPDYMVSAVGNSLTCTYQGELLKSKYIYIEKTSEDYSVSSANSTGAVLYYFDTNGKGTSFTGVYGNKYYKSGKIGVAKKAYNIVYNGKIYKVSENANASVYKKDTSKEGNYKTVVDGVCYSVSYKTGKVSKFTGVYKSKYYKSGKIGVAKKAYNIVYNGKIYKVSEDANASVYKKDTSKKGNYTTVVDGVCYSVSYKTGKVSKFTGVYKSKYYKSGKIGVAKKAYNIVYNGKIYKVSENANASVYKKDASKKGTYKTVVDGVCYSVSYKTGKVSKFTGVYKSKYYKSGKPTNGWQTVDKKTYYCKSGVPVKGIKTVKGKVYYFDKNGVRYSQSGWKTISGSKYYFDKKYAATTGWAIIGRKLYYFTSKGKMVSGKNVEGITLDSTGKATGPAKKYVPKYAEILVASITNPSDSKEKKLETCFNYVVRTYKNSGNPRVPHYTKADWIYVYANDMFGTRGDGNCFSFASAFGFMAKYCGYDEVYCCNTGRHGWTEINGKVYDPQQYKTYGTRIYGGDYSNPTVKRYNPKISDYKTNPWKRVRIP